jgi:hypothetical protein
MHLTMTLKRRKGSHLVLLQHNNSLQTKLPAMCHLPSRPLRPSSIMLGTSSRK